MGWVAPLAAEQGVRYGYRKADRLPSRTVRQERMLVARQDGILTDPVRQVTMAQGMMRGVVDALARLRS